MKVCVVLLAYRSGVCILGTDCWHSSPTLMELHACSSMMKWLYLAHMTRRSNYGTSQLVNFMWLQVVAFILLKEILLLSSCHCGFLFWDWEPYRVYICIRELNLELISMKWCRSSCVLGIVTVGWKVKLSRHTQVFINLAKKQEKPGSDC